MKHSVIVAHPSGSSFNISVARAYADAARVLGQEVVVRDLYRINFAPCLMEDELPFAPNHRPRHDVVAERLLLSGVQVFAFVYPFWFNAPPAILKGYIDRVFGAGFGYAPARAGSEPLLKHRKMITFSSSGAPDHWVVNTGAYEAARRIFDEHFSTVCGLQLLDHIHFGGIVGGIRSDAVAQKLAIVASTVARHFSTVHA
jgi:NAD(P)H dehydrogenase (quinone)